MVRVRSNTAWRDRQVDGFDEELLGSLLDRSDGQFQRTLAGQNYDGNIGVRPLDRLQQLKGIAIREGEIEDGRIRAKLLQLRARVMTVSGLGDHVALRGKEVADS